MPAGGDETVLITTLSDDDIAMRVHMASLSARQEKKYRKVIELLRLYDQGLSSKEIEIRLTITRADRIRLLSEAADVINDVEEKIDVYCAISGGSKPRQKTIGKRSKPSSESIVEPYGDIVMKMVNEGGTHRNIHPAIQELGYTGSANSIYQYILKKRNEEGSAADGEPASTGSSMSRPPKVSIQRVTKTAVYKFVLHEAAARRGKGAAGGTEASTVEAGVTDMAVETGKTVQTSTFYSEDVASIIFGTKKEAVVKKN
jgi:hypothetical protein